MSAATALAFPPRQEVEQTRAKLEHASALLQEVRTIQDANQVRDIVEKAVPTYASQQRLGREISLKATAVKWEAERRIGEFLHLTERAPGGQPYQQRATGSGGEPVATLAELGISKKLSSRAQRVFALPQDAFERVRDGHTRLDREWDELKRAAELEARIAYDDPALDATAVDLRVCSCADLMAAVRPDAVITEPPSGREHLHVFSDLARACANVPAVAVMVALPYLPEVLGRLREHLNYCGGETHGAGLTLLFFQDAADHDRFRARSVLFPKYWWANPLVQRLAGTGDLVCDPFLQPETALAAFQHGRRFVGASLDAGVVADVRWQIGRLSTPVDEAVPR